MSSPLSNLDRECVLCVCGGGGDSLEENWKGGQGQMQGQQSHQKLAVVCLITSTQTREDSLAQWFGGGECRGVFLQSRGVIYKVQEMWVS